MQISTICRCAVQLSLGLILASRFSAAPGLPSCSAQSIAAQPSQSPVDLLDTQLAQADSAALEWPRIFHTADSNPRLLLPQDRTVRHVSTGAYIVEPPSELHHRHRHKGLIIAAAGALATATAVTAAVAWKTLQHLKHAKLRKAEQEAVAAAAAPTDAPAEQTVIAVPISAATDASPALVKATLPSSTVQVQLPARLTVFDPASAPLPSTQSSYTRQRANRQAPIVAVATAPTDDATLQQTDAAVAASMPQASAEENSLDETADDADADAESQAHAEADAECNILLEPPRTDKLHSAQVQHRLKNAALRANTRLGLLRSALQRQQLRAFAQQPNDETYEIHQLQDRSRRRSRRIDN